MEIKTKPELVNMHIDKLKALEKEVWSYYSKVNSFLRFRQSED